MVFKILARKTMLSLEALKKYKYTEFLISTRKLLAFKLSTRTVYDLVNVRIFYPKILVQFSTCGHVTGQSVRKVYNYRLKDGSALYRIILHTRLHFLSYGKPMVTLEGLDV